MSNDNDMTDDTSVRWDKLSTILAFIILVSVPLFIGFASLGWVTLAAIPEWMRYVYVFLCGLSAIWTFGEDSLVALLEAWDTIRGRR